MYGSRAKADFFALFCFSERRDKRYGIVHLAEGFEEVEALTAVDVMRRVGIDAKTVSVTGERTVRGTHGVAVEADLIYEECDYEKCEMIVLPGGLPGASNLEAHEGLTGHIKDFAASGKKLAAICAAPMVFGACGILEERPRPYIRVWRKSSEAGRPQASRSLWTEI